MKTKSFCSWMLSGALMLGGLMIPTLMLSGCGGVNADHYLENTRQSLAASNHPPAYIDGYLDGCSSGKRSAGDRGFKHRKDGSRASRDTLYASGWYEGHIHGRNETIQDRQRSELARNSDQRTPTKAEQEEMRQIWDQLRK